MKYFKYLGLSLLLFSSFLGMGQTVTLTIDKTTMAENGTATITATLNASHAGETIINFTPSGTAILDGDYLVTYTGKGAVTTVAGGNGQGSAANQLYSPPGVAVDASGNVFIADRNNHRIQKWAPGATTGTTVAGGNGQGSAANQLSRPYGVAVDASGNVFIGDYGNHRIQKVTNAPQIIIPAGQTSATLTITGTDDAIDEPDETIILTPSATGADLASSAALNIALTDNDLPPVVSSITATTADGAYKEGQAIAITVTFDKAVTVTGTPQLTLETGSSDAVVDYASGTGTTTLTFNYTIASGQNSDDLDYVATSSLALNSGTITESGGTSDVTLTLPAPGATNSLGANKALVIDTELPTVTGVTSTTVDGSYKSGDVIAITVAFSEVVNVTGTPQLTLETGSSDVAVNYSSGSGSNTLTFNYTIGAG